MIGDGVMPLTQPSPCEKCKYRKAVARAFDMHISGEDCWLECEDYEKWKESKK